MSVFQPFSTMHSVKNGILCLLRHSRLFLVLLWLALAVLPALGAERFPPPEFEPGYKMPPTTLPVPRANWQEYMDVAVLLGALSLATYLALVKRSRRHILFLSIFSLLYFGFYRKGCICSIGSIQDVTLALFNHSYTVPLTVLAFFILPLLFTLFFGRSFCGAVCPLGAIQDVVLVKPVKIPVWLENALGVIPFLYLGLAVLLAATASSFIICEFDPFVAFFRRGGRAEMLALGVGFLLVGMFIGRPYCRFLCPYGALLRCLSFFSKWRVALTTSDCLRCEICDVACPYGAIREPVPEVPAGSKPIPSWAVWVVMIPILALVCGSITQRLATPLSKLNNTVALAEQVAAEDAGKTVEPTDASKAFRQLGKPSSELMAQAWAIRRKFVFGGWLFGLFSGTVLGIKLLTLSLPQARKDYEPDAANCVACGRCYTYCPREISRVKKLAKPIPLKSS